MQPLSKPQFILINIISAAVKLDKIIRHDHIFACSDDVIVTFCEEDLLSFIKYSVCITQDSF